MKRPLNDRMIAGVCSGIAQHCGCDAFWVRLGFVVVSACVFVLPVVGLYVLGAILIKSE